MPRLWPLAALVVACGWGAPAPAQVVWQLDSLTSIGGATTTVVGDPELVATPFGTGLAFDGNDGVLVASNPLAGLSSFTMEMLFRPDPIVNATSNQPRVFHVQTSPSPPDHRAILETRVDGQNWYPDAFLRSQSAGQANPNTVSNLTLIDTTKLFPLGQWHAYAMTYDGATLRAYVNGALQMSGPLAVQGMAPGLVSLGMRSNQVNFFEGVIARVRFSPTALPASGLLSARIPGDYDGDGAVTTADYTAWAASYGATPGPLPHADGDSDGAVTAADYVVWRDHLGPPAAAGAAAPAPGSLALGLVALGSMGCGGRARCGRGGIARRDAGS